MLQILTGKFFRDVELVESLHRGVYFTNYQMPWRGTVYETAVGRLAGSTDFSRSSTMTYEITERLEAVNPDGSRSALISTGGHSVADDFAAVISFALNITCTTDPELTRRLTSGVRPMYGPSSPPKSYLMRVFDEQVFGKDEDSKALSAFIDKLVALDRRTYEGVMRAIKRYVMATHRIGDDIDLAYVLLVASLESLAQDFDGHRPHWTDYDDRKREAVDEALVGVAKVKAQRVRDALLSVEHLSLAQRFRQFTLAHIGPAFFREEAATANGPVNRGDLAAALHQSYVIRSRYVHALREIPRIIASGGTDFELAEVDHKPVLTFSGLTRVARHVIQDFLNRAPVGGPEEFDYRSALPNLIQVRMAAKYWVGQAAGYSAKRARQHLSGFLEQLAEVLARNENAAITDFRDVLAKVEELAPGLAKTEQRVPMIALYHLFHSFEPEEIQRPSAIDFVRRFDADFASPSIESLVAHVILDSDPPWDLPVCERLWAGYFDRKHRRFALNLGSRFEAATALWFAERHRLAGDIGRMRQFVGQAVELYPSHGGLRGFETELSDEPPEIDWRAMLLPRLARRKPGDGTGQ